MKINGINSYARNNNMRKEKQEPTFKNGAIMPLLGFSGNVMQWIEQRGYLISFLIQDGLGMTLPRVYTGFKRDKEVTGKYNVDEGLEVLGREGMTGPYIIGVAPAVLWATRKYCRSTNTNTILIKRLGESFKAMMKNPELDASIKKDPEKFKKYFFKHNLDKIYKNTVPNDKNPEETINFIMNEIKALDSNKREVRDAAIGKISSKINENLVNSSANLYNVNKLYVGEGKEQVAFSTGEVMQALSDFGHDAITKNSGREKLDDAAIENIKNNFAAKRMLTTIGNVVITLGGLALIPKLYTRSDVAPGARTLAQQKEKQQKEQMNTNEQAPAFKGKGINNNGFFSKLGKWITKHTPEKIYQLFEYVGYNFSKTMFACLATFGLLLPRGLQAWKRAEVDKNGKRDMTEINEILLRDTVSSLSVVFAVPMLTKALVRSYEDKVGFVLTNKASEGKNAFKKAWDIIWPYSKLEVMSVADLDAIYSNIDNKNKLMNFAEFVDKKGGDLEKILSKSDNAKMMFNEKTFSLDSIKNLSKKEKNSKIIEMLKKSELTDDIISKVMKGTEGIKKNKIAKMARGLNSLPGFISTVVISPILLGYLIPKLTYFNTRKALAQKLEEENVSSPKTEVAVA